MINALNINYFKATLIPEINRGPDPDSFIEHMTNNYYNKFTKDGRKNYKNIRGVCTFKIEEIIDNDNNKKETILNLYLKSMFNTVLWKIRFITRLFKKST